MHIYVCDYGRHQRIIACDFSSADQKAIDQISDTYIIAWQVVVVVVVAAVAAVAAVAVAIAMALYIVIDVVCIYNDLELVGFSHSSIVWSRMAKILQLLHRKHWN